MEQLDKTRPRPKTQRLTISVIATRSELERKFPFTRTNLERVRLKKKGAQR